jgi:hypothetical protein
MRICRSRIGSPHRRRQLRVEEKLEGDRLFREQHFGHRPDLAQQPIEAEGLARDLELAGLELGEVENVVEDRQELPPGALDDADLALLLLA